MTRFFVGVCFWGFVFAVVVFAVVVVVVVETWHAASLPDGTGMEQEQNRDGTGMEQEQGQEQGQGGVWCGG